mmetsp:Transcript_67993/g.107891  ORF Transcript_67993/g.107891 Transcript_67993/m.107891 type:complete len:225 (-) Transcript_67993:100-774(-)
MRVYRSAGAGDERHLFHPRRCQRPQLQHARHRGRAHLAHFRCHPRKLTAVHLAGQDGARYHHGALGVQQPVCWRPRSRRLPARGRTHRYLHAVHPATARRHCLQTLHLVPHQSRLSLYRRLCLCRIYQAIWRCLCSHHHDGEENNDRAAVLRVLSRQENVSPSPARHRHRLLRVVTHLLGNGHRIQEAGQRAPPRKVNKQMNCGFIIVTAKEKKVMIACANCFD